MTTEKLVVHHLSNSRSQRVLWLLEELEVPYEIKVYRTDSNLRAPKELLSVHSLGKSPVITEGDVTLAETGAIIQYIINKYGNGRVAPPKEGELTDVFFTHFADGSLMPLLINRYSFARVPAQSSFFLRPLLKPVFSALDARRVAGPLRASLRSIEETLEKSPTGWFAGGPNPTMADYMMLFGLETAVDSCPDLVGPKTRSWIDLVHGRPAYKRAVEKGEK
ncbi:hypothetical protein BC826DRAFT_1007071 [Russula brevipes]|nr:hypothetical protein BC826DRAFT_1007071 [Russula brevipes]